MRVRFSRKGILRSHDTMGSQCELTMNRRNQRKREREREKEKEEVLSPNSNASQEEL
jgi:hypothetical protein